MIRIGRVVIVFSLAVVLSEASIAAPRAHVITLGKWSTVQWSPGLGDDKSLPLKIRPLLVDGRIKEYTLGPAHDVTDRLFVVRRAFRVNDSLPDEPVATPHWQWQRGGWLLVDRVTGRIAPVNLPEFDALYSAVTWFRDYAAYCGVSDDGQKLYAVVAQLNRRKPVLRKPLSGSSIAEDAPPDSACPLPAWQRAPTRVTFESGGVKLTFAVRGHVVDLVNDAEEDEEGSK